MKKFVVIMSVLIAAFFGGISVARTPTLSGEAGSVDPAPLDLRPHAKMETATFALG